MNLSICYCKGIIRSTFRTLCTQKVVVVVRFAFQTGTIEVNPATHVARQRRESSWSFIQPFLTASAEPFLRRHLSKTKLRLRANCWEDQGQVWYVFWAILRAPTDFEFWNSSVWRECLPTEIVERQVSRPNWEIAWPKVWCSLGARLESQLYLLMCLVDRQKCFDCAHQCWPARFSALTSRVAAIVRFYFRLFQTEVGCLELCLVYCSLGDNCFLVGWMTQYLTFFGSWSLEFKLIWATSACSSSIAWLVTASLCFSREDVNSCDACTWGRICFLLLATIHRFTFVLRLIFHKTVLIVCCEDSLTLPFDVMARFQMI